MSPQMTQVIGAMILILVLVGLDLLLGAKGITFLSGIFNHRFDVDGAVLKSLANLRTNGEKDVVKIDTAALKGRLRLFLAALLLTPAALLFFIVFLRK